MKKISLLFAALLLLVGCAAPPQVESTPGIVPEAPSVRPVPTEKPVDEAPSATPVPEASAPPPTVTPPVPTDSDVWDGSLETLELRDFPTELSTGEQVLQGGQPLYFVAQAEGESIRLYGLPGGQGLILRVDDMWQYFDLPYYSSLLSYPPVVAQGDYDGDMQLEIALVLGSSDGDDAWDLHIIELDDEGIWAAHWLNPEDYRAILTAGITSAYDAETNALTVFAGESSFSYPLTDADDLSGAETAVFAAPGVRFHCSGDAISASFTVQATSGGTSAALPVAALTASVVYTGSAFGLTDFTLSAVA